MPTGSSPSNDTRAGAFRIASLGQVALAAAMIWLGVMGLIKGGFTPIWTGVPKTLPARAVFAYAIAVVSVGSGVCLLWRRTAALAARVLLVAFSIWMLLFRVPLLFKSPADSVTWWAIGETAAMMAGAWVLVVRFAGDGGGHGFVSGNLGLRLARTLYGLALIPFGIAHFTFLQRTVSMVPGWLPWHLGWAYFTGAAMVVAGVAIVLGVFARLAATLSAWELSLFTLLVWGPVVASGHPTASDWAEVVDSVALTAAAWAVAESYRGARWLGMPAPGPAPAGDTA
jgi:uncharacterized membrane protein